MHLALCLRLVPELCSNCNGGKKHVHNVSSDRVKKNRNESKHMAEIFVFLDHQ